MKMQQNHDLASSELFDLEHFEHKDIFQQTKYPWEVLPRLNKYISEAVAKVPQDSRMKGKIVGSVHMDVDVVVGQGTVIEHGAMIKGPALIGKNCEIRKGAYIRGNALIGDKCVIGNSCQIKNSLIMTGAQVCHFNYVGDSVLGNKSHLSASVITSNLKLNCEKVVVRRGETSLETGLVKFGAAVGDRAQIGCGAILNPGSILGKDCVIYPSASIRGCIPAKHILKVIQQQQLVERRCE